MNESEHLLVCGNEEAVEIARETSNIALALAQNFDKSLRFGLDDRNILHPDGPTNRERLISELNDLLVVIFLMEKHGIIPGDWRNADAVLAKVRKVEKFMEYARGTGALV